jgi:oxygen-independent coproporphyrinogen-3 oxidase
LYALKVEEGTGLESQIQRGKYAMPDDDRAAEMYVVAEEKLDAAGYEHYEISNWAKRVRAEYILPRQSKHNLTYWLNQPYLGFGAGAHSYFNGERYWNILSPLEYIERVGRGEAVVDGTETIDRATEMAETMFLGLRLSRGVVFDEFIARFGEDAREKYRAQLAELNGLGLIELSDAVVRLTPRGRLLSNEVFWRFLP